jgi:hypothetical protein
MVHRFEIRTTAVLLRRLKLSGLIAPTPSERG